MSSTVSDPTLPSQLGGTGPARGFPAASVPREDRSSVPRRSGTFPSEILAPFPGLFSNPARYDPVRNARATILATHEGRKERLQNRSRETRGPPENREGVHGGGQNR
ncbi:hypothetical protein Bbelb_010190 [Branchiostoma belcheri]|nr:hypothetical protein Bbelb_010190 [Branchiostoma belcheri]